MYSLLRVLLYNSKYRTNFEMQSVVRPFSFLLPLRFTFTFLQLWSLKVSKLRIDCFERIIWKVQIDCYVRIYSLCPDHFSFPQVFWVLSLNLLYLTLNPHNVLMKPFLLYECMNKVCPNDILWGTIFWPLRTFLSDG